MKIGSDPEFFIRASNGTPVPAHRYFGGKDAKEELPDGVKLFRDGYVLELNIPPAHGVQQLARSVQLGLLGAARKLPAGYHLSVSPAAFIDLAKDLDGAPDDVLHFGCDPSYDAYTGLEKRPAVSAREHPRRYAGGHMHFSVTPEEIDKGRFGWLQHKENHLLFIRMLDYRVGVPLTWLFAHPMQYVRREVYGQAGEFRPQEYPDGSVGLEYRTPSPEIWSNLAVAAFCFNVGQHVFENFGMYAKVWDAGKEEAIRRAVNTGEGLNEVIPVEQRVIMEHLNRPWFQNFNLAGQLLV